ncbi:MAG: nicotinate (nicotinamide) nucleotide adenylyltransferase [Chlorobium sp.]|nr:MAG: nicotinate (nicotinamide) nucleotide adenylyltransferase [Chlorobium sp.]
MRLAVFGGSFDPPHNGHLALALFARELLALDRIIISVSNNPFKPNRAAGEPHRARMTELLAREINLAGTCCEVSHWELEKRHSSYTVDLVRHIKSSYRQERLVLLLGEDSFTEFPSWKEHEALVEMCDIVVFRRALHDGSARMSESNARIRIINFHYPVSSTDIRALVASGKSVSTLVPSSIHCYMTQQALYR